MKKFLKLFTLALVVSVGLVSCGGGEKTETKTEKSTDATSAATEETFKEPFIIGATAVPHAEILEFIKPTLEEKGMTVEIKVFNDYNTPNEALADGSINANFFQHKPYLDSFIADRGLDLIDVANIHIEPMGVYSKTIKSFDEITDGAKVSIPNDPTNGGRALMLLEKAELIKLDPNAGLEATPADITENPKNLEFLPMDAAQLPRTLEDVTISVINSNYALEGGLDPIVDSMFNETGDSPYANIIAVRTEDKDDPKVTALIQVLQSDEVKAFIEEKYKGAIVAAF